ncbi:hypothetical protein BCT30_15700 [Enterovibrio norvegicus]|uniref:Uncharacterized membrane protein YkvA, DUF1232 family n=2 Tax=Enterovibrio norvegicus TaxID=188144 RepID=A0A1I5KVY6_9GAMM|nr:YkvA family protein [Enterovibrio norvegicus]MCC4800288.1 DUF1232 domain-containing protein [Enterovibrio norvegicus]OEF56547.1 hypothetical protein A1OU_17480 [Enterovibrio norvegicus]PMH65079.1 hypothetical protein BCU62_13765 [Enterovibrio norvegicus]PMI29742.1 hypothetical protein BCU47_18835 [Enterovibrio norvegicus]PMI38883.1 hypothetical protein BCU46_07245 [Enterovibrio norvegicus]
MSDNKYLDEYSDASFWSKVKGFAQKAGYDVLEKALKLYYSATDDDTPKWAKTTIFASLGYFITPIDAIPDLTPVVGFSDDLGVLVAAAAAVVMHVKSEHSDKANEKLGQWFNKDGDTEKSDE